MKIEMKLNSLYETKQRLYLAVFVISALMVTIFPKELLAQNTKIKGLQSFVTQVEDTPVQGEKFKVIYTLTAKYWGDGGHPLQGKGLRLLDVKYKTRKVGNVSQMIATATYISSRIGEVTLPGMTVPIGNSQAVSESKTIEILPNPKYGEEMSRAHSFLVQHGQHPDSICLMMTEQTDYYWLFQDEYNLCACAMAPKDMWEILTDPVLFYSTENVMNVSGQHYRKLLQPYYAQLDFLRQQNAIIDKNTKKTRKKKEKKGMPAATETPYTPLNSHVSPLLGDLHWGQGEPYNTSSPVVSGKKALIGCVPLSMGMVMDYYCWPEKGRGVAYYKTGNRLNKIDFSKLKPQWTAYKKQYNRDDRDKALPSLSRLLVDLGHATDASFSGDGTSTSLANIKVVLCNNLDYSSRMTYVQEGLSEAEIAATIYREIDNQRPCMVYYEGHAFICDGYDGEYLHYNLGWYGSCNGYYRIKLTPLSNDVAEGNTILIKSLVFGIEPAKLQLSKSVTVEKAGTLSELLTDEEKASITTLSIAGCINGKDILLLRKMGGANNKHPFDGEWQGGALNILHLDNATIINDDTPYLSERATGIWTFSGMVKGMMHTVNYDMEKMDKATWKAFKKDIGDRQPGVFYTRTADNTYYAHYTTQDNVIGRRMFQDCSSLSIITLPKNTKKVDGYAFYGCTLLKQIRLPETVEEVGENPFFNCPSLERIEAPKIFSDHETILEGCSPALNQLTTY
ncbi:MAG: C10 family peptidase [Prevotella sp.]|nr:C10 family peptidase [Prevotella sp.]